MRDPAFLEPTTHGGGHPLIRLPVLLLIAFGFFLFVGTDTAQADGLLDGVVEPVEQAADALPVNEVVDVLLPSPEPGPQPEGEPPPAEPAPSSAPAPQPEPPASATAPAPAEPTNRPPALPDDTVDDTVSIVSEVVTGPTGDTATETGTGITLPAPAETVSGVVSTVVPEPGATSLIGAVTEAVPDLEQMVTPVVDQVVENVPIPPLTEVTPTISRVVESADGVIGAVVETVEPPIDQLFGMLPPVLDDVLSPTPGLIDETLEVLIETVDPLLPGLEPPEADESSPSPVERRDRGSVPGEGISPPPGVPDPLPAPGTPEISPSPAPNVAVGGRPDAAPWESGRVRSPSMFALPLMSGGRAVSNASGPDSTSSDWVRGLDLAFSSSSTSGSGPALGLLAVLVLTGLALPRMSRWLRLQPVLWRPNALAVAIERPG